MAFEQRYFVRVDTGGGHCAEYDGCTIQPFGDRLAIKFARTRDSDLSGHRPWLGLAKIEHVTDMVNRSDVLTVRRCG